MTLTTDPDDILKSISVERADSAVSVPVGDLRQFVEAYKQFSAIVSAASAVAKSHECMNGYWRVDDPEMTRLRATLAQTKEVMG